MSGWASTSPEIDKVSAAFVKAAGSLHDIVKDRTADAGTYKYNYADLSAATSLARPVLAEHGLIVTQTPVTDGREVSVATTILHESGQWLAYPALSMPGGNTAQQAGSALSYARRYSLMAILGLATEDDDGAGAGERQAPAQARQEPTFSAEAIAMFNELFSAPTSVKQAVKAYAESKGRKLTREAFEDEAWRVELANVIDEAKNIPMEQGSAPA